MCVDSKFFVESLCVKNCVNGSLVQVKESYVWEGQIVLGRSIIYMEFCQIVGNNVVCVEWVRLGGQNVCWRYENRKELILDFELGV